ncbi:MAG: hypothetical protein GY853_01005 [PVC group bacterium]|nr:hypothetical protein [PVC group bacterium]
MSRIRNDVISNFSHKLPFNEVGWGDFTTVMGTESEQWLFSKYQRLYKLNDCRSNEGQRKKKKHYELRRLLSGLQLPIMLYESILKKDALYYSQAQEDKLRDVFTSLPIALYLHCTENNIFVNRRDLYSLMRCDKKKFNQGLLKVLERNKELTGKLRSEDFRRKYILTILHGLKASLNCPHGFIKLSYLYILECFEELKGKKDTVIVSFIYYMVRQKLPELPPLRIACRFLGIEQSTISNNKKLINKCLGRLRF